MAQEAAAACCEPTFKVRVIRSLGEGLVTVTVRPPGIPLPLACLVGFSLSMVRPV